jgi:hypothetical protein
MSPGQDSRHCVPQRSGQPRASKLLQTPHNSRSDRSSVGGSVGWPLRHEPVSWHHHRRLRICWGLPARQNAENRGAQARPGYAQNAPARPRLAVCLLDTSMAYGPSLARRTARPGFAKTTALGRIRTCDRRFRKPNRRIALIRYPIDTYELTRCRQRGKMRKTGAHRHALDTPRTSAVVPPFATGAGPARIKLAEVERDHVAVALKAGLVEVLLRAVGSRLAHGSVGIKTRCVRYKGYQRPPPAQAVALLSRDHGRRRSGRTPTALRRWGQAIPTITPVPGLGVMPIGSQIARVAPERCHNLNEEAVRPWSGCSTLWVSSFGHATMEERNASPYHGMEGGRWLTQPWRLIAQTQAPPPGAGRCAPRTP